ncbi:MAG: T9SS type A sorting domain-containing protein [Candidatus Zixiibacteriota bacterium]|nr:MAG: T9SS type A sorting domain-containing protein [candidate division Zixibacteria bacterium]
MKIIILFCTLFMLIGAYSLSFAQTPDTLWTRTFGGPGNDYVYDLKQTSDGGYILAGSGTFGTGGWNIYLVKTDAGGDTIWTRFFDADDSDWASSVRQTDDDGYIVACHGFTNLIKLNEYGDSLWSHDYGIVANSVWLTDDGGYIIGGGVIQDPCIIKTDSLGNVIWNHVYNSDYFGRINYIQQTFDGEYMAVGTANSVQNWSDYYIMKIDDSGDTLWTRSYGSTGPEEAYCAQQTSDGGYILSGLFFWTVKTDARGDTVWSRYYGYGGTGCAFSIQETRDGGYIIGGRVNRPFTEDAQFYLVKTDPDGNVDWDFEYGGTGWDLGHNVCQTDDGGYAIAGWSDSCGIGGMDILLIRLGYPTEVKETFAPVPEYTSLSGNYPNPFNSSTTIEFTLDRPQIVALTVYDLLGREIRTLLNEKKSAGKHRIPFDASPLSSGVYFYMLQAGDKIETKRMLLLR